MTDMKRTTISLPDEMVESLDQIRATPEFSGLTYSELLRRMILEGLKQQQEKESA